MMNGAVEMEHAENQLVQERESLIVKRCRELRKAATRETITFWLAFTVVIVDALFLV
jgi:hypothetical protein